MSDWTPATPDNLPWGEVVEVRWPGGSRPVKARPWPYFDGVAWWIEGRTTPYSIYGTEWRHGYNERMDKDGG